MDDAPTVDEEGTVVVSVLANDSDPDGDPLTVTAVSNPTNGTAVINGDGTITYTPDPDFNGTDSFTYVVCDDEGQCDSATATVTVDAVNDDPVATADTVVTAEDTAVVTPVFANDADVDGDTLTVSAFDTTSANGGTVSCTAAGDCTYTPPAGFSGTDTYTYTADDGNGGMTTATVTVTVVAVNDAPGAVDDTPVTAEDTPIVVPITGNDSDPEGDTLTIDFFTQPAQGSVTDNLDGTVTYTPPADWNGTTSFVYRVCDDGTPSMCDEATVTVTVTAVNDDPVGNNDGAATDAGDAVVVNVLTNDTDVEADALTVSSFDATSTNGGTVSCTAGGDCTYTPPSGFSGTDQFEYTVSDGNGGTDVAEVTVVVTAVNSRPVTVSDAVTVTEDVPLDIPTSALLINDTDPDGPSPLTITAVTNGSHGTVTLAGGVATYTPAPDYFGADAFTYTVCDGANGCSVETVTVTVDPVNDPPVAQDDTATTDEDVPVVVDVLANDSDVEGDTLTVTAIPTAPASGTATINGDNTITYTPAANFSGVDEFEYEISDGNGGITTAWVRFIVVNPVNDAPVAIDDAATVDEDGSVTVPVLSNDGDIENDELTVVSTSTPAEGTVTINPDGSITYVPDPDYSGPDSFTYTVCDTGGLCDTAAIDVAVSAVNDEPVAVDDAAMVLEDGSVTVPVLLNDSDIEGDDLTIVSVSDPAGGTTAIVGADVVFTPEPDFFGSVTFTYTVADGNGGSATGTVTVVVQPVNDALVYSGPTTLVLGVSATPPSLPAVDAEGDPLTYAVVGGELPPGLTLNADGTWSGAAGQGTFEVTIEACDDQVPPACTLLPLELQVTLLADTGANPITPLAFAALLLLIGSALVLVAGSSGRPTFG